MAVRDTGIATVSWRRKMYCYRGLASWELHGTASSSRKVASIVETRSAIAETRIAIMETRIAIVETRMAIVENEIAS